MELPRSKKGGGKKRAIKELQERVSGWAVEPGTVHDVLMTRVRKGEDENFISEKTLREIGTWQEKYGYDVSTILASTNGVNRVNRALKMSDTLEEFRERLEPVELSLQITFDRE